MEICEGGIDGGVGGKGLPPATRIEVLIGPCQRGKPGYRGAGGVVVGGGGGKGERERSSDGMMMKVVKTI